jgi:hypothetical protein
MRRAHRIAAAVLLTGISLAGGAAPAQPAPTVATHDFISRTSVWIARPPAAVWPVMCDFARWKQYNPGPRHLSGKVGEIGEVLLASEGPSEGGHPPERLYLQRLRSEPSRQLLMKLWTENGLESRGYIDFSLAEENGGTRFTYSVYVEMRSDKQSADALAEMVERSRKAAEPRFDAENLRLKALVEGSP